MVDTCSLCGLEAPSPVVRTVAGQDRRFCCTGCAQVYDVAAEAGLLDMVLAKTTGRSASLDSLVGPKETAYFAVKGMWCAGCALSAERLLRRQPGVRSVDVGFASERGRVSYDPNVADPRKLLETLSRLGYHAHLLSDSKEAVVERRLESLQIQAIVALAFGMQVMMVYLAMLYSRYAAGDYSGTQTRDLQYVALALALPALVVGGRSFLLGAWRALRARTATMDTLVALGTVSAYGYSVYASATGSGATYFDSVVMITAVVMIGRYLESAGGSRARRDINALLTLQPDKAWVRQDGIWSQIDSSALLAGTDILVKQGERVPADAVGLEGDSVVDESLLTGESTPVAKGPGEELGAGMLLVDGALVARVTRPVAQSRLAVISHLIEETLAQKPPVQRLADRASAYFAYGILATAVATLAIRLALGRPVSASIVAAVAVLVVACPCALGLATPLALTVSLGVAARAGLVVRNPAALEIAATIKRVVFDKTGTVTRGRLTLEEVVPVERGRVDLLRVAASVEQFSEHPVARAIVAACDKTLFAAADFQVRRGQGAGARLAGDAHPTLVGSPAYLGLGDETTTAAEKYADTGRTVVWVGRPGVAYGYLALRDELAPTARQALELVYASGVRATVLSGDDPRTVRVIAAEVSAQEWAGRLSPADKADRIRAWQAAGERVAMVGDGVNDAPALAQSDLSFAMAEGTDLAGQTSDVIVTGGDLRAVPLFLRLSGRTRRVIKENLAWAFAYNLVAIPLAAAGLVSPMIAAATMAASSVMVVGNSLRLRRARARAQSQLRQ